MTDVCFDSKPLTEIESTTGSLNQIPSGSPSHVTDKSYVSLEVSLFSTVNSILISSFRVIDMYESSKSV